MWGKFLTERYLCSAWKKNHIGRETFYRCLKWEEYFSSAKELEVYEMIHTGEKPYLCSVYLKTGVSNLMTHEKTLIERTLMHTLMVGKAWVIIQHVRHTREEKTQNDIGKQPCLCQKGTREFFPLTQELNPYWKVTGIRRWWTVGPSTVLQTQLYLRFLTPV